MKSYHQIHQHNRKKEDKPNYSFANVAEPILKYMSKEQREDLIEKLTNEMYQAAKDLDFERAAFLRDEISR
jgi:excinuclease ABC subunit B